MPRRARAASREPVRYLHVDRVEAGRCGLNPAGTTLLSKQQSLTARRVDEDSLVRRSRPSPRKRARVPVSAPRHLRHLLIVPLIERLELSRPSQCLGMARIASLPLRQHVPDRVKFPMLAQQMLAAQDSARQVPDPHAQGRWTRYSGIEVADSRWIAMRPRDASDLTAVCAPRLDKPVPCASC